MEQNTNYRYATFSRRRALALAGTGATGLAAAALVGCSSSGSKGAQPSNAPAGTAVASTAPGKPKPGGTIRYAVNKEPDSIDPHVSPGATAHPLAANVYSRLFTFEPGVGSPASGKVIPDLAQNFEQPDPLTLIVRLNPAAKFDEREPLNGRALNANDVVQTWKRFADKSFYRATLSNAASEDAPIESVEAVDASTVRIKSKFPDGSLFSLLAHTLWIEPVEGLSGKIDLTKEMRGTGPFLFDQLRTGVSVSFKRNPNWFMGAKELPYVDGIQVSIIPEQAQLEAQFRAKHLHFGAVSRPNIPIIAKELPGTEIAVGTTPPGSQFLGMSYAPGQPWHDVRVRRAMSMSIDRDKLAEVILNPKQFESLGVKLNVRWNAPMSAGYGGYWLDPKGSSFGPAAVNLRYNIPEAVKLLAAAGYSPSKPLEFDMIFPGTYYATDWPDRAQTMQSMMKDAGFKANLVTVDYATDYIPKVVKAKAQFKGRKVEPAVQLIPGGAQPDPLAFLFAYYGSNGANSATGTEFPQLDEMLRKVRPVTKFEERVAGIHDVQRWMIDNMVGVPTAPDTEQVDLVWQALQGPQTYRPWTIGGSTFSTSGNTYLYPNYWFKEQI